jgi:E3 ubiquitin-protein ligase HECTD2
LINECVISFLRSRISRSDGLNPGSEGGFYKERARSASVPSTPPHEDEGWKVGAEASIYYSHNPEYHILDSPKSITHKASQLFLSPKSPAGNVNTAPSRPPPSPPVHHLGQVTNPSAPSPEEPNFHVAKTIFRSLETYLAACLNGCECLNASFSLSRNPYPVRASSEASLLAGKPKRKEVVKAFDASLSSLDAKTLLLGDFAENGMWWTGNRRQVQDKPARVSQDISEGEACDRRSSRIDWGALKEWYDSIFSCGMSWRTQWNQLHQAERNLPLSAAEENEIEDLLAQARYHVQRSFLKSAENLLRRPGRPLKSPEDCRFLFILFANPLLYSGVYASESSKPNAANHGHSSAGLTPHSESHRAKPPTSARRTLFSRTDKSVRSGATGLHSGIIKRILGLLANVPNESHLSFISWFRRYPESHFVRLVELVGGFVSYRLSRQRGRGRSTSKRNQTRGLVPNISGPGSGTPAHLHAAVGASGSSKTPDSSEKTVVYDEDWQIKAAAKVMSLLFTANNTGRSQHPDPQKTKAEHGLEVSSTSARHGQIVPTSAFYNTMLDYTDLIADFEAWESRRGKFSFCQYPMFLSIWAKIHIMEYDARRQMEVKAREAFFNSILSRKVVNQYLVLKVRRDCLVDDSLRSVSEVVGTGQEEIKKGLKIEFTGEEGVDAGGLRKEWFLLLVREVFDPEYGLFVYEEESNYCYFNPSSFETSDQFFLVGVVLGLAIYNSTILDIALPPFAFRKLLASAPAYTGPATSSTRISASYTLDDLAEWKPSLAKGLKQLLEQEGNVEETYCRDFVVDVDRYGQIIQVPLCPNGENRPVTNSNRKEFIDLYIRYLLDTAVVRQFEPFKRGFFTVCGGNALSLFRPEEIELLIRGSDEPLDVESLHAVCITEGWPAFANGGEDIVLTWFWDAFRTANPKDQRRLLGFITGSDRIPAMGATNLIIKITWLGDRRERYPIARTCFNQVGLYKYRSRSELEERLWRAVAESEGFGLK